MLDLVWRKENEAENEQMTDPAWIELAEREEDEVWTNVFDYLAFNPSVHAKNFPGFTEPAPSLTYSFRDIWGENYAALNSDLETKALAIFRQATSAEEFIFALDWQHRCYKFYPHRVGVEGCKAWLIPPLPNGDYAVFLEKSFAYGWLGHPWEQTICLFGQPILLALESHPPQVFRNTLRQRHAI